MDKIYVEHYVGESQRTGKEYNAIRLTIGDWNTLIFPKSSFESKYIFGILDSKEK